MGSEHDSDIAARQGLEKLGYTQEMTRVRILIPGGCPMLTMASVRRPVACSMLSSVSSIRRVLPCSHAHMLSRAVTLGSSDVATRLMQELTCPWYQLSWPSVRCTSDVWTRIMLTRTKPTVWLPQ